MAADHRSPTASGSARSCSSRPRWRPSSPISTGFIEAFPTVEALAAANEQHVLRLLGRVGVLSSREAIASGRSGDCRGARRDVPSRSRGGSQAPGHRTLHGRSDSLHGIRRPRTHPGGQHSPRLGAAAGPSRRRHCDSRHAHVLGRGRSRVTSPRVRHAEPVAHGIGRDGLHAQGPAMRRLPGRVPLPRPGRGPSSRDPRGKAEAVGGTTSRSCGDRPPARPRVADPSDRGWALVGTLGFSTISDSQSAVRAGCIGNLPRGSIGLRAWRFGPKATSQHSATA